MSSQHTNESQLNKGAEPRGKGQSATRRSGCAGRVFCFRVPSVPGVLGARNTIGACRMACSMPRFLWSFEWLVPFSPAYAAVVR